jgi:glutamine amidotransferase
MCRLTVYKGRPLLIGDLITNPNNSLILQSRDAAFHPLVIDKSHRRNILVNGDGFGVAWYGRNVAKGSCLFKFVTPAWSNTNLRNIGDHVESSLIFAHIRAASSGHDPLEHVAVSHENCHPFKYGQFTFMHNGGIPNFSQIKLMLLNKLHPIFFQDLKGSTDSEHIFALFLTVLFESKATTDCKQETFHIENLVHAIKTTITMIIELCANCGVTEPCSLNLCLSDGINIIVTRFRNGSSSPPSLYYNFGSNFVCEDGMFYSNGGTDSPSDIVISSAPLSKVKAYQPSCNMDFLPRRGSPQETSGSESEHDICEEDIGSWILMPKNHMLIVHGDAENLNVVSSVKIEPIVIHSSPTMGPRTKVKASSKPIGKIKPNQTTKSRSRSGSGTFTGAFTKPVRRPLEVVAELEEQEE